MAWDAGWAVFMVALCLFFLGVFKVSEKLFRGSVVATTRREGETQGEADRRLEHSGFRVASSLVILTCVVFYAVLVVTH
jgi:hypothetical protein